MKTSNVKKKVKTKPRKRPQVDGARKTVRHRRVALQMARIDAGIEPPMSRGEILRRAGYSEATAKNPKYVFESQGFLAVMDAVGLSDEFIMKALHEDISKKPQNRYNELKLASQIKGWTREKEEKNLNVLVLPNNILDKYSIESNDDSQ